MAAGVTFKVDAREFTATMRRYRDYTRRTPEEIVNTKGFFIARRAVLETKKADKGKLQKYFGRLIKVKGVANKQLAAKAGTKRPDVPMLEAIIRARIYRKGGQQPTHAEVQEQMRRMYSAIMRSIAFIKSGWIGAIKKLEPLAATRKGVARQDRTAAQVGAQKGDARPARSAGWVARCILWNTAAARSDKGGATRFGMDGLQKAFDYETASMKQFIEDKMRENAAKAGIKVH